MQLAALNKGEPSIALEDFLNWFFRELSDSRVPSCVLRNHEKLPQENIGSDIDILLPRSHMRRVAEILLSCSRVRITSFLARSYVSTVFVSGIVVPGRTDHCLQFDFVHERSYKGLSYLDVDTVLAYTAQHTK